MCPDDINKHCILTAPAITLSDHRAVYDTKCRRPQGGGVGVWSNADTCGQGGGGYKKGSFFADVVYGRPLTANATNVSTGLSSNSSQVLHVDQIMFHLNCKYNSFKLLKTNSATLIPIPSSLLKDCTTLLVPTITKITNLS